MYIEIYQAGLSSATLSQRFRYEHLYMVRDNYVNSVSILLSLATYIGPSC